jgi:hypothetical protein
MSEVLYLLVMTVTVVQCCAVVQTNSFEIIHLFIVVSQMIVTGGSLQDCKDALNLAASDG